MREAAYQKTVIDKLEAMFPGCVIIKNDAGAIQGIPDLLVLWGNRWGMLEVKAAERSPVRPNQEYYVQEFSQMSFASFIYPEIEEGVLQEFYHFMTV